MTSSRRISELEIWLAEHLSQLLDSGDEIVEILHLTQELRSDPIASGLGMPFTNRHEIRPKFAFTVRDENQDISLGIIEYSEKALGLKGIGEMQVFARMANPKYAIILCNKSLSRELLQLKADPEISDRLFNYGSGRSILTFDLNV